MKVLLKNVKMPIGHNEKDLQKVSQRLLRVPVKNFEIGKKSVDARDKSYVFYVYSIIAEIEDKFFSEIKNKNCEIYNKKDYQYKKANKTPEHAPIIVGSGPAGLFAALTLIKAGISPIIIERGKEVSERKADLEKLFNIGELNPESNVLFGEGGAGTYSDGKLTTGIKDPRVSQVFREFVNFGAPESILYENKPHIGTDYLEKIVENIRKYIISMGGKFLFSHKLSGINSENGELKGITVLNNGEEHYFETDELVLAIGHSARDTYALLHEAGIKMEQKPFSVGFRIEHEREFINRLQYGKYGEKLPASDYKLSAKARDGRGVYTFCVCPGGVVILSASEPGGLCVNGMSYYNRDAVNTNGAILVSVTPSDFPSSHPLSGIEFQRELEKAAFIAGGSDYKAPVQLVSDFLVNKPTERLNGIEPSIKPGYKLCDLNQFFPTFITDAIKDGINEFDKKCPGFLHQDAVLTALESRSSAPVRIVRDADYNSSIRGILPCGEGAGYAGGIVSAAVDGMKCGENIANKYS